MLPLANTIEHCFNTNAVKNRVTINRKVKQINPNHRACQSGEKATINVKKANLQF